MLTVKIKMTDNHNKFSKNEAEIPAGVTDSDQTLSMTVEVNIYLMLHKVKEIDLSVFLKTSISRNLSTTTIKQGSFIKCLL